MYEVKFKVDGLLIADPGSSMPKPHGGITIGRAITERPDLFAVAEPPLRPDLPNLDRSHQG